MVTPDFGSKPSFHWALVKTTNVRQLLRHNLPGVAVRANSILVMASNLLDKSDQTPA